MGDNLFKDGFADAVTKEDSKLGSLFAGTFIRLRYVMSAIKNGKQAARMQYAENLFRKALEKTPAAVGGLADDDERDVQYSIEKDEKGNAIVKSDREVLSGNDRNEWRRQVSAFFNDVLLKDGSLTVGSTEGQTLQITKKETFNKNRDWYKQEKGKRVLLSDNEFFVKMQALSHVDELAQAAEMRKDASGNVAVWEDTKNHPFAADGFVYSDVLFENADGTRYVVTMSIGMKNGVGTVYNVGKIKGPMQRQTPQKSMTSDRFVGSRRENSGSMHTSVSDITVLQNTGDVNSQYMQNSENDARGNTQHAFADDADGGVAVEEKAKTDGKVQPDADAYTKYRDDTLAPGRVMKALQDTSDADAIGEVKQKAEAEETKRRTKFQKKQEAELGDLLRRFKNRAISEEEYKSEQARLIDEAVAENDRKWKSGNRGPAAIREMLGSDNRYMRENYIQKEVEQERQERREKAAVAEEKKEKTALKNKVIRLMDEAKDRLAHPQKNRHIPLQHTQTIIDLLQAITVAEEEKQRYIAAAREKLGDAVYPATKTRFENQIKKAMDSGDAVSRQLDRLAMEYKELQKSDTMKCAYAPELDAVISGFAESIRGKTLSDMTAEEMNTAADIVQSVMYAEDNARVIPAGIFGDEEVAVDDIVPDMIAEIRQNTVRVPRAVKNFQMYFSDPIATFNMLGGWHKNSLWSKLGNSIVRESTYREMAVVAKFNELFRDVAQDKDFQRGMEYSPKNMVDGIGLVDAAGNAVSISRGTMLALYAHLGCSSNLEEIMTAGLQVPDLKAYYKGENNQAYVDGKKVGVSGSNAAQIASLRLNLQDAVTRTNELRERFYALREEMQTDMRADADGAAEIAAEIDGAELKGRKAAIRDAYYELQEAETTESKLQQQYDAALRGERQRWLSVRNAIEDEMTKSEKAYMTKVSEWFNEHQKGFINEPYLNLYGIPRATVKNYFPRHRMMDLVHHSVESIRVD